MKETTTHNAKSGPVSPKTSNRGGFTFVELLISIAVFAILVTIAAGGFTQALRTQRQATQLLLANSNAGFILEQMAREMRTGGIFSCDVTPCDGASEQLDFVNASGTPIMYRYDAGKKAVMRSEELGGQEMQITSQSVAVEYLRFYVEHEEPYENGDRYPTRITILLGIAPKDTTLTGNVLNFQTSVSARFDE